MSALKIGYTLDKIEQNMMVLAPYRNPALFRRFLVQGYTAITLSSVPASRFSDLLQAKICLGTLITLCDDFADRPTQSRPQLLEKLYRLKFGHAHLHRNVDSYDRRVLDFAYSLFAEIEGNLQKMPHYDYLLPVLNFDLTQFYSANQLSSLLTLNPGMSNVLENQLYAHHNMGMVIVAMMDLMANEKIDFKELGLMREVFLLGQRLGRIFNVLTTYKREKLDGDITGELSVYTRQNEIEVAERKLRQEVKDLYEKIREYDERITTFSVQEYLEGLIKVQNLHTCMKGVI